MRVTLCTAIPFYLILLFCCIFNRVPLLVNCSADIQNEMSARDALLTWPWDARIRDWVLHGERLASLGRALGHFLRTLPFGFYYANFILHCFWARISLYYGRWMRIWPLKKVSPLAGSAHLHGGFCHFWSEEISGSRLYANLLFVCRGQLQLNSSSKSNHNSDPAEWGGVVLARIRVSFEWPLCCQRGEQSSIKQVRRAGFWPKRMGWGWGCRPEAFGPEPGLGPLHMAHKTMLKSKAKPLAQNPRQ